MLDNYLKHTKLDMDNNSQKNYASALYTLITVFFFWGFLAASNGIFIPFCKTHFNLTQFESQLIDFTFYGGYFIGSLILFYASKIIKVDIDVYPDGRTSAEIEYEIEIINIPDYCGEEITGNKEWSNLNIAKKNKIQNGKPSRRRKTTTKQSLGKKSQGIQSFS